MEKILVSACLLGDKTRYDGKANYIKAIEDVKTKYLIVPFCPEVEGGLKTPRDPSEICKDRVISSKGKDVTNNYKDGARKALNICLYLGIKKVLLKSNSPSCSKYQTYDGTFTHHLIDRAGITAKLLAHYKIEVYDETEIDELLKDEVETEENIDEVKE